MAIPDHLKLRLRNIKRLLHQATYHYLIARQIETVLAKFVSATDEGELMTDIYQLVNRSHSPEDINPERLHNTAVKWFHIAMQETVKESPGDSCG